MSRAQTERAEPKRITNPSRKRYSRRNDPRAKWFRPTKEIFFCAHFCESADVENLARRSNWRCSDEHGEFFRWQEFPQANWSRDQGFYRPWPRRDGRPQDSAAAGTSPTAPALFHSNSSVKFEWELEGRGAVMRNVAMFAVCAALSLASAVPAKADAIPAPRMTTASFSSINAVAVVSLESLSKEAQEQVYAATTRMSDDQLRALRQSIDTLPAASEALKSQNLRPSDVLAAVINGEGQLLLITAVVI
ncbi:MAG: hypothetical protein JO068_01930 [Hyphomicrobiales bacterium]|nr:hypothetical protein [Hyphomicrobiales bacterium]